jgi:hypothetical protein
MEHEGIVLQEGPPKEDAPLFSLHISQFEITEVSSPVFVFEAVGVRKEASIAVLVSFVGAVSEDADATEERTHILLRESLVVNARRQLPGELLGAAFVDLPAAARV